MRGFDAQVRNFLVEDEVVCLEEDAEVFGIRVRLAELIAELPRGGKAGIAEIAHPDADAEPG